jgi:DNA-binding NarL/FixJ family response regulator
MASPNKEIAEQLGLSISTVETHATHVFQKLGVQSRAEALLLLTQGKK